MMDNNTPMAHCLIRATYLIQCHICEIHEIFELKIFGSEKRRILSLWIDCTIIYCSFHELRWKLKSHWDDDGGSVFSHNGPLSCIVLWWEQKFVSNWKRQSRQFDLTNDQGYYISLLNSISNPQARTVNIWNWNVSMLNSLNATLVVESNESARFPPFPIRVISHKPKTTQAKYNWDVIYLCRY